MKHLEVRQEYSAGSSGDETLRLMLDKLHNIKDTHLRIVSVEYLSFKAHKTPFPFLISRKDLLKLNTITIDMMTSDVLSEKDKKACYHKATIVATLVTFGINSLQGSLLSGCRYFRGPKTMKQSWH